MIVIDPVTFSCLSLLISKIHSLLHPKHFDKVLYNLSSLKNFILVLMTYKSKLYRQRIVIPMFSTYPLYKRPYGTGIVRNILYES